MSSFACFLNNMKGLYSKLYSNPTLCYLKCCLKSSLHEINFHSDDEKSCTSATTCSNYFTPFITASINSFPISNSANLGVIKF